MPILRFVCVLLIKPFIFIVAILSLFLSFGVILVLHSLLCFIDFSILLLPLSACMLLIMCVMLGALLFAFCCSVGFVLSPFPPTGKGQERVSFFSLCYHCSFDFNVLRFNRMSSFFFTSLLLAAFLMLLFVCPLGVGIRSRCCG